MIGLEKNSISNDRSINCLIDLYVYYKFLVAIDNLFQI